MSEPTLFLIAYEDSYLSELKVAFEDAVLAQEHADDTGGTVIPITVFDRAPEKAIRFTHVCEMDSRGIIKRRDFFKTVEYEYENPIEVLPGATKTSVVKTRGYTRVTTYGYDQSLTAADHEHAIKLNKGIEL